MPKTSIIVKKIPIEPGRKIDKPALFAPMSDMFLEYFENKTKLRKNFVNDKYKKNENEKLESRVLKPVQRTNVKQPKTEGIIEPAAPTQPGRFSKTPPPQPGRFSKTPPPQPGRFSKTPPPQPGRLLKTPINPELTRLIRQTEEDYEIDDNANVFDDDEDLVDIKMLRQRLEEFGGSSDDDMRSDISDDGARTDDESEIIDDLKSVISDASSVESAKDDVSISSKYATPRNKRGYVDAGERRGVENPEPVPYTNLRKEEEKRELLFKFEMLKRSYPGASIRQDFNMKTDLDTIKASYEMNVRRLSMDSKIEKYKSYLMGAFMATEYACGHFLGLDMQGYTQQQILQMSSYEKLLVELGEKTYVPHSVSKLPVEARLLFLVIMNAAIFIGSKMIMAKTGANLLNMVNSMNNFKTPGENFTSAQPQSNVPQQPRKRTFGRRKMRGPNINVSDL
jgi:hypothetical protein